MFATLLSYILLALGLGPRTALPTLPLLIVHSHPWFWDLDVINLVTLLPSGRYIKTAPSIKTIPYVSLPQSGSLDAIGLPAVSAWVAATPSFSGS